MHVMVHLPCSLCCILLKLVLSSIDKFTLPDAGTTVSNADNDRTGGSQGGGNTSMGCLHSAERGLGDNADTRLHLNIIQHLA